MAEVEIKREFFTASELAAMRLPSLPTTPQSILRIATQGGWKRPGVCRRHEGQGAGFEFHYSALPLPAQAAIFSRFGVPAPSQESVGDAEESGAKSWVWFERQTERRREEARRRLALLLRVAELADAGNGRVWAVEAVAKEAAIGVSTIRDWLGLVRGVARSDWLPALTPVARGGKRAKIKVPEKVWDVLAADYLRPSQPSFESCYRRTADIAREQGWEMPNKRTLHRRVQALDPGLVAMARKGGEAVKKMYPAQVRSRAHFHALQAVNTDGHKWDVFVRWPDGSVGRPMMIAFQDLYSGKFLAWRTARSENKDTVRLAFGDMIERYGIPDRCYLDNGRAFASKWLTGGTPNRYRFKVKAEDPMGIMTQLGVEIHWTTPYAGQSKPIERGFGDFARDIAKHPAFEGAYCGNSPMAKPENYGSRAIPIEEFIAITDREIAAHNARAGRRSEVCGGTLSFDQAFEQSYAQSMIRRGTAEQRRLCLLAGEQVLVRPDGTMHLFGNRYFDESLWAHRGERVTVRFDPDHLHAPLTVHSTQGVFLAMAREIEAVGFDDTEAARRHAQARGEHRKATRALLDAERKLSLAELAALQPDPPKADPLPAPAAIRPLRSVRGNLALQEQFDAPEEAVDADILKFDRDFGRAVRMLRAAQDDGLGPD
jgi:transposase InsO family protein